MGAAIIQAEQARFRIHGSRMLSPPLDLIVEDREFVWIVEQDSRRAEALASMLCGLSRPTAGRLLLFGLDVAQSTTEQLELLRASRIAFAGVGCSLFGELSLHENLEIPLIFRGMPPDLRDLIVSSELQAAGLAGHADSQAGTLPGDLRLLATAVRANAVRPELLIVHSVPPPNPETLAALIAYLTASTRERRTCVVFISSEPPPDRSEWRIAPILVGR